MHPLSSKMIKNLSTGKLLAKEHIRCSTLLSQARGLMFRSRHSLVMELPEERIVPLHMMFVFYPIDVLFLDSEKRVVEQRLDFKPFTFYTPKKESRYVVELPHPKGVETNINDLLEF